MRKTSLNKLVEYNDYTKQQIGVFDIIVNYKSLERINIDVEEFAKVLNIKVKTNGKLTIIKRDDIISKNLNSPKGWSLQVEEYGEELKEIFSFEFIRDFVYFDGTQDNIDIKWLHNFKIKGVDGYDVYQSTHFEVHYWFERSDLPPLHSQINYMSSEAVGFILDEYDIIINTQRFQELNINIEIFTKVTNRVIIANDKIIRVPYYRNFYSKSEVLNFIQEYLIDIFKLKENIDYVYLVNSRVIEADWVRLVSEIECMGKGYEFNIKLLA